MPLSPPDRQFIDRRERLTRYWPVVGFALLALILGFSGWAWIDVPHLINPWAVFAALEAGTLPNSTLTLMAAMLPVVMLTLVALLTLLVLLLFAVFSRERRLIRLIRTQLPPPGRAE